MRIRLLLASVACTALSGSVATADQLVAGNFNVIVTGNYTTNQHVEGKTLIVGNVNGSGSPVFAQNYNYGSQSDDTLIVGGTVNTPSQLQNGKAVVIGNHGNLSFNGSAGYESDPAKISTAQGYLSAAASTISNLSSYYSGLTAQPGNTTTHANSSETFTVNSVDSHGVAIFNLSSSDLNASNTTFKLNIANGVTPTTILFNVTGGQNITFGNGSNFDSSFGSRTDVVFNFGTASETLTTNSGFDGTILGSNLSVVSNAGNTYGGIYVDNFTMNTEAHLPQINGRANELAFTGYQPTVIPVPEPGSLAISCMGGVVVLFAIYRRRRFRQAA